MTQTVSPSDTARIAAEATLATLPIADQLDIGTPIADPAALAFDGVAVTARFTGGRSGEVLIAVERSVADALTNSAIGGLDITAALHPSLEAAANTVGTVVLGPGQVLDVHPALDALLTKANVAIVPLSFEGVVRAVVGLAVTETPTVSAIASAPSYPTAEELRAENGSASTATTAAQPRTSPVRQGLDLLRDVQMEVTAQIGGTRMTVNELLGLVDGAVVELDRAAGAPADLLVNGHLIARGEVVVIDENFGLRITEIVVDDEAGHAPA